MPIANSAATDLRDTDRRLRAFANTLLDLTPFWRELGERLAETAQSRWPLRRRTGGLRESLTWGGSRLGRGGVFEATPDRLTFGSALFYGRFAQHGTKHTPRRPIIHVDAPTHTQYLSAWLRDRAAAAGLEVT